MTTQTTPEIQTRGHLEIQNPTEYVDRTLATASWWDKYLLQPGRYPFLLTNLDWQPWQPGYVAPGYTGPTGPYYAVAKVDALLIETYREARLLSEVRAERKAVSENATVTVRLYAYELNTRKSWGGIGRIVVPNDTREDTYPCLAALTDEDYALVRMAAVKWLDRHGHGNYAKDPDWHMWNRLNANALGGTPGFVKAIIESNHLRGRG